MGNWVRVTWLSVNTPPVTVANLGVPSAGLRRFVTDATLTLTAGIGTVVIGLGSNPVPVVADGSAWRIG